MQKNPKYKNTILDIYDFFEERISYVRNNEINHNSFDKQFFRDYLTSIKWNNNQIQLPKDIKNSLLEKYQVAYNLITI